MYLQKILSGVLITTISLLLTNCKVKNEHNAPTFFKKEYIEDYSVFREILESTHPNLYRYCSKEKLDKYFEENASKIKKGMSEVDFYKLLVDILYQVQCGHTDVFLSTTTNEAIKKEKGFFPVNLKYVKGAMVVLSESDILPFGSTILAINNVPAKEIIDKVGALNYRDGGNKYYRYYGLENFFNYDYYIQYGMQKKFNVQYIDTNGYVKAKLIESKSFDEFSKDDVSGYYKANDIDYDFYINEKRKFGYLNITTFSYVSSSRSDAYFNFIDNSFTVLQNRPDIQNLVMDLRDNSGGSESCIFYLYNYLSDKRIARYDSIYCITKKIQYQKYCVSDSTTQAEVLDDLQTAFEKKKIGGKYYGIDSLKVYDDGFNNMYRKKLYVLINENTFSAASLLAAILQNQKRAILVGNEAGTNIYHHTAGSFLNYELPNTKIRLTVPVFGYDYIMQPNTSKRIGCLEPDYYSTPTKKDMLTNDDTEINFITDSLLVK